MCHRSIPKKNLNFTVISWWIQVLPRNPSLTLVSKRGMVVSQRIQTLLSLKNPNLAFISLGDRNFKGIKGYKPIHNINSERQKHHLKITLHIFSQICHCRIQVYISWYLLAMAGKKKNPESHIRPACNYAYQAGYKNLEHWMAILINSLVLTYFCYAL